MAGASAQIYLQVGSLIVAGNIEVLVGLNIKVWPHLSGHVATGAVIVAHNYARYVLS